jgi:hypothetical protein
MPTEKVSKKQRGSLKSNSVNAKVTKFDTAVLRFVKRSNPSPAKLTAFIQDEWLKKTKSFLPASTAGKWWRIIILPPLGRWSIVQSPARASLRSPLTGLPPIHRADLSPPSRPSRISESPLNRSRPPSPAINCLPRLGW